MKILHFLSMLLLLIALLSIENQVQPVIFKATDIFQLIGGFDKYTIYVNTNTIHIFYLYIFLSNLYAALPFSFL